MPGFTPDAQQTSGFTPDTPPSPTGGFKPDPQPATGGFRPDGATENPGTPYDFDKARALWIKNGGAITAADIMAHVMLAESGGNPNASNKNKDGSIDTGLWQINSIHGDPKLWSDPDANAKKAIDLYNHFGLNPWKSSFSQPGGGGWGRYVGQVSPETRAEADVSQDPAQFAKTLKREQFTPATHVATGGLGQVPGITQAFDHAADATKAIVGPSSVAMADNWWKMWGDPTFSAAKNSLEAFSNVESTAFRGVVTYQNEMQKLITGQATPPKIESFKDFLSVASGPIQKAIASAETPEDTMVLTNMIERDMHKTLHLSDIGIADPDHYPWYAKLAEDMGVQTGLDPFTYVPLVDLFTTGARLTKVLSHAAVGNATIQHMASAVGGVGAGWVGRAGQKAMNSTVAGAHFVHKGAKAIFADRRPELNKWFGEHKVARMGIEALADHVTAEYGRRVGDVINQSLPGRVKSAVTRTPQARLYDAPHPAVRNEALRNAWRYGSSADRKNAELAGFRPSPEDKKAAPQALNYLKFDKNLTPKFDLPKTQRALKALAARPNSTFNTAVKLAIAHPTAFSLVPTHIAAGSLSLTQRDVAIARNVLTQWALGRRMTAQKTAEWIGAFPQVFSGKIPATSSSLVDFLEKNISNSPEKLLNLHKAFGPTPNDADKAILAVTDTWTGAMRKVSGFWKQGIMVNVSPHGLMNVVLGLGPLRMGPARIGRTLQLASELYHARISQPGGLMHAVNALAGKSQYTLSPETQKLYNTVTAAGGITSYWREPSGLLKLQGLRQLAGAASEMLDALENGTRMAYWEYLDKLDGHAPADLNEMYARAGRVMNDIGDYKNATKFVQILQNIGGVFAHFGADIAPRGVLNAMVRQGLFAGKLPGLATRMGVPGGKGPWQALAHLPMVPLTGHAEADINQDDDVRDGMGIPSDQHFNLGGPTADTMALISPRRDTSNAMIGPVASSIGHYAFDQRTMEDPPNFEQESLRELGQGIPGYDFGAAIDTHLNPYDRGEDIPAALAAWFLFMGGYDQRQPSNRTERRAYHNLQKTEDSMLP